MKKNRIISLLLALVIAVMPLVAFASGENSGERVPEYMGDLLEALDVMSASEVNLDREIERSYAANIIFRLIGGEEGTASGTVYSDVTADTSYGYAIERTTELGYFLGNGDGTFNPSGKISLAGMARLLLQFAGYGVATDQSGVVSQVYKSTSHYGNTTYKDLAHMIFNVLNMDAIYVKSVTDNDSQYYTTDDFTVMSALFDVYEAKGTITENGLTGLWSGSSLASDEINLSTDEGNIVIKVGNTDIAKNIGRSVKVYFRYDEEYDEFTALVYQFLANEEVEVINLRDFNFATSSSVELQYSDGNKEKKIRYDAETAIIYNGTYYADAGFDLRNLDGLEGEVVAINSDADRYVDVLDITAYETYVIKSVNLTDCIVYAKNRSDVLSLDEEDYDSFSLNYVNGKKVYLEDFDPGMVLSVAKNAASSNKQVIKALISEEYVRGNVTDIIDLDGRRYITIQGENYYILPYITTIPTGNKEVYAILSAFGNVAYFDTAKAIGNNYGLVTRVNIENERALIRMINFDGDFIEYQTADKIRIDGEKFILQEDIRDKMNSFPGTKIDGASLPDGCLPIAYKLNAEGHIVDIDTPNTGSGEGADRLTRIATVNGDKGVLREDCIIGGEIPGNSDTPMIRVDAGVNSSNKIEKYIVNDRENYSISTLGELSTPREMKFAAFTTDPKSKVPHFVICHSNILTWGANKDDFMFIVDKVKQAWDDSTQQILTKLIGYEKGVVKEYFVSPEYKATFDAMDLHRGDVLRFSTGAYGHIVAVEESRPTVYHDTDADGDSSDNGIWLRNIKEAGYQLRGDFTNGYDNLMLLYGYVLEREGDLITIGFKEVGDFGSSPSGIKIEGTRTIQDLEGDKVLVRVPASGCTITVFDSVKNEIFPATYDEIKSYDNTGKNCSLVLARYRNSKMVELVVFNNSSMYN